MSEVEFVITTALNGLMADDQNTHNTFSFQLRKPMNYQIKKRSEEYYKDLEKKKEWTDLTILLKSLSSRRLRNVIKFSKEEIQKRRKRGRGEL